jgi:hypothetical protein
MRRRAVTATLLATAAASLSLFAGGLTSAASAHTRHAAAPGGRLVRANPHQALPLHGGVVDSLNWSGYAVTGSGITAVSSTFTVPAAGLVPPGFAATWTGIGGFNTTDLIQAGTSENSLPSNPLVGPQYNAWYELLPNAETPITGCTGDGNCTVTPGNVMKVDIHLVSGSTWNISIVDTGHWTWALNVQYQSSKSSAEWILEAPTLVAVQTLLAPVGTAHFGPTSTYTAGGVTHTIAAGNPTTVVLSPGVVNEATPSALSTDGQSFNDCAYAQTCAAP